MVCLYHKDILIEPLRVSLSQKHLRCFLVVGTFIQTEYDSFGNIKTVRTYGGNNLQSTTTYAYDVTGNVLSETAPWGGTKKYEYDKEDNLVKAITATGKETEYIYDMINQPIERTDEDGTAIYEYDKVGNITKTADPTGSTGFGYDALYRLIQTDVDDVDFEATEPGAPTLFALVPTQKTTTYEYDANDNQTKITYPDGNEVIKEYDLLGNMTKLIDHDGMVIEYDYDLLGQVLKEVHNSTKTDNTLLGTTTEYSYNSEGYLIGLLETTNNNVNRMKISYIYDDVGNVKQELREGMGIYKDNTTSNYSYDTADKLTQTQVVNFATSSIVNSSYTYDIAGNITNDGNYTYTYDIGNRVILKQGNGERIRYNYDSDGNLVEEISNTGVK